MKTISTAPLLFLMSVTFYCCSPVKEENPATGKVQNDTTQIIQTFIYGLWSKDSGNTLINDGYYFKNDGTIDFIASEATGNWELKGNDSLKIEFNSWDQTHRATLKIDSLSESRMVLTDSEGVHVYRKVPFGMNMEGNVVQGFSGYINAGESKEYSFELPPVKKIMLKMACPDSSVTFRLYDAGQHEITSADVRNWAGIVVRSGKYRLVLSKPKVSKWKDEADYDVKVMVF